MLPLPLSPKGRGSHVDPPNRFARLQVVDDWEQCGDDPEQLAELAAVKTEYFVDDSQSIIAQNDSPDVPFNYSLNAYRGCAHGCSYCFARPSHEYLDLSAGLDFETKIFVKEKAPDLFRDWLRRPQWKPEPIMMSGVTDCYQPAERHFQLTRQCLEVAGAARQPMTIITKNALIVRDLDLLSAMRVDRLIGVAVSLTSLDQTLTRKMEPRTSSPAARLEAIAKLSAAGIPVRVMVAPIIPGLNDHELPAILKAAKEAGAQSAGYVLLRLPWSVKPVFFEWIDRNFPDCKSRIESFIRSTREGQLYNSQFGKRLRGTGPIAEHVRQSFAVFAKKYQLDNPSPPLDLTRFQPPTAANGQRQLF